MKAIIAFALVIGCLIWLVPQKFVDRIVEKPVEKIVYQDRIVEKSSEDQQVIKMKPETLVPHWVPSKPNKYHVCRHGHRLVKYREDSRSVEYHCIDCGQIRQIGKGK